MAKTARLFSDLDFNLTPHPVTKDLVRRLDDNAIKQALKNLIMIKNFEKPFHSDIGTPVSALLFEPLTPVTALMVRRAIVDQISNFEPRVVLLEVDVIASEEQNSLYVSIVFRIVNSERPITLDLTLERTR